MKFKLLAIIIGATCCLHATETKMVQIPAGAYKRADGRNIHIKTFSMLNTELSWSQFKVVRDWAEKQGYDFEEGIGQANLPAQNICWYDAVKWCNALSEMTGKTPVYYTNDKKIYKKGRVDLTNANVKWDANGYRLPTEAEWEYAYRAGTSTSFYWGDFPREGAAINHQYAVFHIWGTDEIDGAPLALGSKLPNAWKLYDMAGNVEEWVWDRYAIAYKGVKTDNPHGPDTGQLRVIRGGGFVIDRLFSADVRHMSYPFWINCDIGFRIASSNPKEQAKELSAIKALPLTANDIKPFSEAHKILDIREDTDEAACKRLFPLLDLNRPDMRIVRDAYAKKDFTGALVALRDLLVPRLKASDLTPFQSFNFVPKVANRWLDIYRQKRPIRWVGPKADIKGAWHFMTNHHLSTGFVKEQKQEYIDAYFWMLNDVALRGKPIWNRLSAIEKGAQGKPRYCFYTFIGFDAGAPLRPFKYIAWMLQHGMSNKAVPPRILANALYFCVVDRLPGGLQDDRANVSNQIWGNAMEIIEFSQLFPELKDAKMLYDVGLSRMHSAIGTVMRDGSDLEASLNYNVRLFSDREKINRLFPNQKNGRNGWSISTVTVTIAIICTHHLPLLLQAFQQ